MKKELYVEIQDGVSSKSCNWKCQVKSEIEKLRAAKEEERAAKEKERVAKENYYCHFDHFMLIALQTLVELGYV